MKYRKCTYYLHEGDRTLPNDAAHFSQRRGRITNLCRKCATLANVMSKGKKDPTLWAVVQTRRQIAKKGIHWVGFLLRGPEFGFPLHLPDGCLPCSLCFKIKRRTFFADPNNVVEPVCRSCQRERIP